MVELIIFCLLLVPIIREIFFQYLGRWLYIFLFASSTAALLTPIMIATATRAGIVDTPGGRKIHNRETPLLGGVVIIISFISALLANMILDARDIALLGGGTFVAIVGIIDDWKGIRARYKLILQIAVVILLIHSGIILDLFPTQTTWGYLLNALLSILWIVGLTNSMNFIDGMDGLAT
ncbi:MAG: MraY family glycosyltransferase, partial [Deltaproteobacteria bacterium]|nr:MraY family glycosyltransferase [Deltaproteobacteria bacterium]